MTEMTQKTRKKTAITWVRFYEMNVFFMVGLFGFVTINNISYYQKSRSTLKLDSFATDLLNIHIETWSPWQCGQWDNKHDLARETQISGYSRYCFSVLSIFLSSFTWLPSSLLTKYSSLLFLLQQLRWFILLSLFTKK